MVSSLKSLFRANIGLLCDGVFFQIRCYRYIVNHIGQAGFKLINGVVNKVHNGIKHIKKNKVLTRKDFMKLLKKVFT